MTLLRAPWLEAHDKFEGVGAHELNPRYDHVDGGWFRNRWAGRHMSPLEVPQLTLARALVAGAPRLDGHDGSHHQVDAGPVDFLELARACWWLAWKATQSTSYVDPTYDDVVAEAHRFAMFFAYHWLSSTTAPATQALHYLEATEGPGRPPGAMLDAEEAGITVDKCLEWCETVEAERRRPAAVYSGIYVAGGSIWRSNALRMSRYGPRPFHVAAYTTEERLIAIMMSRGLLPDYPFDAWQFSSNGPVPGITGRADMNRIDNRPAYARAAGIDPAPPTQENTDMIRLLTPHTDAAQFLAMCDQGEVAIRCEWTGPGDNGGPVDQRVAAHRAEHDRRYPGIPFALALDDRAPFRNISLDGELPAGWSPDDFANPVEIRRRMAAAPDLTSLSADIAALKVTTSLTRAVISSAADVLAELDG